MDLHNENTQPLEQRHNKQEDEAEYISSEQERRQMDKNGEHDTNPLAPYVRQFEQEEFEARERRQREEQEERERQNKEEKERRNREEEEDDSESESDIESDASAMTDGDF